jgi:hypothetical protein
MLASSGTPTGGITIARLSRLAAGIARLAASKARRWTASQKAGAHCGTCATLFPTDSGARPPIRHTKPADDGERVSARFHTILVWVWVALLLIVVGYATVEGEHVLAELDTLKVLAAYSTGVRRLVRPDAVVPAAAAQRRQSPSATRVP